MYFVSLCKQIATDNEYFILLKLLLNNMGKYHNFSRLNLRQVFPVLLFLKDFLLKQSYFLHRSQDIMKKVDDYSFWVAAVLWLTLFLGIIPYIHNGFWKLEQASANKQNINEM